jgi:hypothetical protein
LDESPLGASAPLDDAFLVAFHASPAAIVPEKERDSSVVATARFHASVLGFAALGAAMPAAALQPVACFLDRFEVRPCFRTQHGGGERVFA